MVAATRSCSFWARAAASCAARASRSFCRAILATSQSCFASAVICFLWAAAAALSSFCSFFLGVFLPPLLVVLLPRAPELLSLSEDSKLSPYCGILGVAVGLEAGYAFSPLFGGNLIAQFVDFTSVELVVDLVVVEELFELFCFNF